MLIRFVTVRVKCIDLQAGRYDTRAGSLVTSWRSKFMIQCNEYIN